MIFLDIRCEERVLNVSFFGLNGCILKGEIVSTYLKSLLAYAEYQLAYCKVSIINSDS